MSAAGTKTAQPMAELDALLTELHNTTSQTSHSSSSNAAENMPRYTQQQYRNAPHTGPQPLDNLITDLQNSISRTSVANNRLSQNSNRSSTGSDSFRNSQQEPQISSARAHAQRAPIETNLDEAMRSKLRIEDQRHSINPPNPQAQRSNVDRTRPSADPRGYTSTQVTAVWNRAGSIQPDQQDTQELYDVPGVAGVGSRLEENIYDNNTQQEDIYYDNSVPLHQLKQGQTAAASSAPSSLMAGFPETYRTDNPRGATIRQAAAAAGPSSLPGGPPPPPPGATFDEMADAVLNKLANHGVRTVKKGLCGRCDTEVHGPLITAVGKVWHPTCFVCVVCSKSLANEEFFEKQGDAFCEACYHSSFAPKCASCNQPITADFVLALDVNFHPECFCCGSCGTRLGDETVSYHEHQGQAFCSPCYAHKFAPRCRGKRCGGEAIFENSVQAIGGFWHPECFVCDQCGQDFATKANFYEYEGRPYCDVCYHDKRGSLCSGCKQPITGRCITAMGGKKFHPEHFVCVFCLRQLNKGTFREHQQSPYCHPCFVKLFA